jgi:hypothetical protein
MISAPFDLATDDDANPLDLVEDFFESKGWTITRSEDDLMVATVPGAKAKYEISMEWQEEFSALLFACTMPVEIGLNQIEAAARTLEQVNQNLWLGHFDLSAKNKHPTFRHTFLFRMIPSGLAVDIVQDVVEIAMAECNRFYSTFLLVQAGDIRLADNLHAATFETIGEA